MLAADLDARALPGDAVRAGGAHDRPAAPAILVLERRVGRSAVLAWASGIAAKVEHGAQSAPARSLALESRAVNR